MLNSANNRTNYTVTLVTENLACDSKELLIYGDQSISHHDVMYPNEKLHFVGTKKILRLESSFVNNDQNECVFIHICQDICHYVFIYVKNVPDGMSWKIC